MSSYDGNNQYVGGGYNNPDEMVNQGWGKNYGQQGGTQSYSDNVDNTGMGPAAYPQRGSHTFGSHSPELSSATRAERPSSYYDEENYNAGGARGPRSASAMDDPYNPGGRAGDAGHGPRRSSMGSASSTRSFDDSAHLGEGASGRGSRGYQTGMGRNISGERTSSYSTGTSSKPGTGGWKGAAKRLASRLSVGGKHGEGGV
ncbi:hypothetical protein V493_01772 [Pseudogymnoascus sp. VKM F-4281 (FW-2241)]|nr:hypothetical protein V493_01772 [Pseudogymnoascus sp. VKM F-4281 (FW-2241)]